jgi:hypothetical protein
MITRRIALALVMLVAASSSCARETAPAPAKETQFEFGARRVQVIVPAGWEALDQGRQKRFRKGEFGIVLQYLEPANPLPRDQVEFMSWGLAAVGEAVGRDLRREIKSRRTIMIDGRPATEIETWNRLDHTNPARILLVPDDGAVLALYTERMALEESLAAFDAIRDSIRLR